MRAICAWSVKPRPPPSWHCRDTRVYSFTTMSMHDNEHTHPRARYSSPREGWVENSPRFHSLPTRSWLWGGARGGKEDHRLPEFRIYGICCLDALGWKGNAISSCVHTTETPHHPPRYACVRVRIVLCTARSDHSTYWVYAPPSQVAPGKQHGSYL